jgi:hypothetical protein
MGKPARLINIFIFSLFFLLTGCTGRSTAAVTRMPFTPTPSPVPSDTPAPTATPTITATREPLYVSTATAVPKESQPLLLVHFMPWYQAPPKEGSWGWHWTMNHFSPGKKGENGQREIASHFYPLTGPYDSRDPDILEYQVLLMKLSGIDGNRRLVWQ